MLLLNSNNDDDDDHKDSCPSSHVVNMPYAVLNTARAVGETEARKGYTKYLSIHSLL